MPQTKTYFVTTRNNNPDQPEWGVYVTAYNKAGARRAVGGTILKIEEVEKVGDRG